MRFDITPAMWQLWCFAVLMLAMVISVRSDMRSRRIPNGLVLSLLVAGIALNGLGPENGHGGLFADFPGALGAPQAVLGALTGLALFLPFYALRAMGAGDVKLMAALGSFVGPLEALNLGLSVLLAGGVLAVLRMGWGGKSHRVWGNVRVVLGGACGGAVPEFDPATQSVERMPYALAFAGGLLFYGAWRLGGGVPFIAG